MIPYALQTSTEARSDFWLQPFSVLSSDRLSWGLKLGESRRKP